MLKKVITTSQKIAQLKSDTARLLYSWMIPFTDVDGRMRANPYIIKGLIFPLLQHSPQRIETLLQELHEVGLIILYKNGNDEYLQVQEFHTHQYIDRKKESTSKIPPPPEQLQSNSRATPEQLRHKYKLKSKLKDKFNKENIVDSKPLTDIEIIEIQWNEFAEKHDLAKIREIKKASSREKHIKARMDEDKEFDFQKTLAIIEDSPFLLGKTKAEFNVFFDWIFLPTNYQKIMEGNYLDRRKKAQGGIASWLKKYGEKE